MGNIFKTYGGLPKQVYILFIINIINSIGAFVGPFMTLYLSNILKLDNDLTAIFVAASFIFALMGSLIGGKLVDKFGSKRVMIIFQLLTILCYIICSTMSRSMVVPYFLILSRFFNSMIQPATSALVANITDASNRKTAYSLLYLGVNVGFSIGPGIAGFLFEHFIIMLFIGNAIVNFISVIIVFIFIKAVPKNKVVESEEVEESYEKKGLIRVLLNRPYIIVFCLIIFIFSFIYSQINYCMPIQMDALFDNSSVVFGNMMMINGACVIFLTTFIVVLTKNYSNIFNISISGIFYALGFGVLYFANTPVWFYATTIIWTIGEVLNTTNIGVYLANNSPASHRGRILALNPFINSAGSAIGPILMSKFIGLYDIKFAWVLICILSIVASIVTFILYIYQKNFYKNRAM